MAEKVSGLTHYGRIVVSSNPYKDIVLFHIKLKKLCESSEDLQDILLTKAFSLLNYMILIFAKNQKI